MRETQATIKLGINSATGPSSVTAVRGFGRFPENVQLATFEQVWQRMRLAGRAADCHRLR